MTLLPKTTATFMKILFSIPFILSFVSCSKEKSDDNITDNLNDSTYSYSHLTFNSDTTTLTPGDNLGEAIENANSGDVIELEAGTYQYVELRNVHKNKYTLIRNKGNGIVKLTDIYYHLDMRKCSYLIFDGITFDGGGMGVYILNCDHIIIMNCEMKNMMQEGIQVQQDSKFVDIVNCKIHNTGLTNAKWGEGIYVGTAGQYDSDGDGNKNKYDYTSRVWIENCEIYSTGHGDGINFKGDVMESTIRGCHLYDIAPGTYEQANEGAINLEALIDQSNIVRRNNFVENNTIENVSGGFVGNAAGGYNNANFNNGIAMFGAGNTIQNNTIKNCSNLGIHGNSYENQSTLVNYVYNNIITGCSSEMDIDSEINVSETSNPNPFNSQMVHQ
jgi:hypothetical protein